MQTGSENSIPQLGFRVQVQTGSENSIASLVNDDSILGSSLGRFRNAVGVKADPSTLFLQGD